MNMFLRLLRHWAVKWSHGGSTCEQIDAFIVDYIDGRLEPGVRHRFLKHIENCSCCKSFLEAYRRTIALSRAYGERATTEPALRMPVELVEAILAAKSASA